MNRTPRDNKLIEKWQGNDNFKLCNYILGGVRVSSAKDQNEPPNIQSYQIDIKMGEATITEQKTPLQAITEGRQLKDLDVLRAQYDQQKMSQDHGTHYERRYFDGDADMTTNDNITLYKDFNNNLAATRRTTKPAVSGRRGSSCSSAGNETHNNMIRAVVLYLMFRV